MTRWILVVAISAVAVGQTHHQQHHPPKDAAEYAKILNDPARDEWQKPHEVITALKIKPNDAVADLGAGSGYFAQRLARHAALVYAVDIDAKLLEMAAKGGSDRIKTILADPDDPKLPPSSVDLIFICDVLHHIENRGAYYGKLKTALKPNGRIVVIDFFKKELPVGPPPSMKLTESQVEDEFRAAGFKLARQHKTLPYQYFLEFER
jgi:ubiquinone/menaquinone biosynthesis C-methylase UbiE